MVKVIKFRDGLNSYVERYWFLCMYVALYYVIKVGDSEKSSWGLGVRVSWRQSRPALARRSSQGPLLGVVLRSLRSSLYCSYHHNVRAIAIAIAVTPLLPQMFLSNKAIILAIPDPNGFLAATAPIRVAASTTLVPSILLPQLLPFFLLPQIFLLT